MRLSPTQIRKARWFNEVAAIVSLLAGVFLVLSLASYRVTDATWFRWSPGTGAPGNWGGRAGALAAESLLQLLGTASFLVPVLLIALGWRRFRRRKEDPPSLGNLIGHGLLIVALAALLDLLYGWISYGGETFSAGGNVIGARLGNGLRAVFNVPGALIVSAALLASAIVVTTRFSFATAGEVIAEKLGTVSRQLLERWREGRAGRSVASKGRAVARTPARKTRVVRPEPDGSPPREPLVEIPAIPTEGSRAPLDPPPVERAPDRSKARKRVPVQAALPLDGGSAGFTLPPLDLLNPPGEQHREDEKALLDRARQLTEKFREFSVDGNVVAIHPGPVVTTFEFKPDAGVKYSKILGLVDDLCLGLKAESVRIDRMPGRSTVGIEVPNRRQETIFPRELLSADVFRESRSRLTLALGKDLSGDVFIAELDRMPHLLIAGATGAGKSVGVNGMIASILYKATPAEVRFIFIDTKMIELGNYADIPHLLIPVVTDPKAASTALKWAVREMEQRYRKLASQGVRNIDQFNALLDEEPNRTMIEDRTGEEISLAKLPSIVIVIDEMADLMMVSSADVEESVMRLAQMARAVGIHLILATQRPSVDVITGTIKANFPARIAFRVAQRVDSRTIIDQQGAEHLLGRGDMLFLPPGSSRLVRLHGGFITEPEVNRIVAFLKKQAKPVYDESVLKDPEEERVGYDAGERDTMFLEAVRLILQEGQCSITLIQRRLRLGYARAARIVDMMEQEGIIGPADGSKPREVLAGPEVLETLETTH